MSEAGGRFRIARLVGRGILFAAIAIAAGSAIAGGGHHGQGRQGQITPPQLAAPVAPAAATAASPAPDWVALIYNKIQDENDKILNAQGELADAQDRTTNLTGWMIGIGMVLILLFAGILFFAWRNARASTEAARALPVLERAYVFLSRDVALLPPESLGSSSAVRMTFRVGFTNHGRTPAVVRWVNLNQQYLSEPPVGVYEDHERHGAGVVIGPGDSQVYSERELVIPRSEWEKAEAGDGGLFLHGRVVYEDIFSAQHETYFCWRYDVASRAFSVFGSESLNRHD